MYPRVSRALPVPLPVGNPTLLKGTGLLRVRVNPRDPRVSIQKLKIIIQIYNTCLDTNNKPCACPCSHMCCPGLHSCSLFMCAHPALVPTLLLFTLLFTAVHIAVWCHSYCHLLLFMLPWPLFMCTCPTLMLLFILLFALPFTLPFYAICVRLWHGF